MLGIGLYGILGKRAQLVAASFDRWEEAWAFRQVPTESIGGVKRCSRKISSRMRNR